MSPLQYWDPAWNADGMPLTESIAVVAHRGSNAEEPEHTLAAYLRALDEGADALECDVRLTADGTLILVHDRRIDRTSSGSGIVSRMTLNELSTFDYSVGEKEWQSIETPFRTSAERAQVLTLEKFIEATLDYHRPVGLAIETKHPTRFGKYVEIELAELLTRFGLVESAGNQDCDVRVMSFSNRALQRAERLMPSVPRVLLTDRIPRKYRDGVLPKGVNLTGTSIENIRRDPSYVEKVQARGSGIHVWAVDAPSDIQLCIDLQVDAIITNRPALVLSMLRC